MDKETLSNYGWVVICIIIIAIMLALATPFGNFIKEAVEGAVNAFAGVADTELKKVDGVADSFTLGTLGE